ncbi:MAG: hypothetical protein O8C56_12135 [Candidatus Methanoperedens sp.]|nr:hypothetical protein [Candidatus Methanoperedens sp.]
MKACSFDDEKSCAGGDCPGCSINPNAQDWREFHKYTDAIHACAEDTRKGAQS